MVAYNFKGQFADAVESGQKSRTIRAPRKDGRLPEPGAVLQLYTGMRTKSCRKLADAICTGVQSVEITDDYLAVGGWRLPSGDAQKFAEKDGFKSASQMRDFFKSEHGLPFSGWLIKWKLC